MGTIREPFNPTKHESVRPENITKGVYNESIPGGHKDACQRPN